MPFRVRNLEQVDLSRWFEIGARPADLGGAVDALRRTLLDTAQGQHFRLVAIDGKEAVVGRIGGYLTYTGRLTFWAASQKPGLARADRREISHALISECLRIASISPHIRFAEIHPAHDTPDLDVLFEVVESTGMRMIALGHRYEWDYRTSLPVSCEESRTPYRLLPYTDDEYAILVDLFASVQHQTFDREYLDCAHSPEEIIKELSQIAGLECRTKFWHIAFLDRPVGYVLCNIDNTSEADQRGTILSVGVHPSFRGRQAGHFMLRHVLQRISSCNISKMDAYVDELNIPSIKMITTLGFRRQPGQYWTWRFKINR